MARGRWDRQSKHLVFECMFVTHLIPNIAQYALEPTENEPPSMWLIEIMCMTTSDGQG